MANGLSVVPDDPASVMERALKRERAAREQAESLLENKARALYRANQALSAQNSDIVRRNREIEKAHEALQKAQAQLLQSEKLASVGQLAAGVAHEINNPMGFIRSNLGSLKTYVDVMRQLIRGYRRYTASVAGQIPDPLILEEMRKLEDAEDIDFILEDIDELLTDSIGGADRVKDIVQGLKSFSRVDDAQLGDEDLHAGIVSTLKVVANELKYRCDVETNFGELPLINCNITQLNQVFLNLLVNAAQAMEERGTITISTWADAGFAYVEIRDTGPGIPEDKLGKIFDPFYTTKPVGSGTGLGLSISYGIVEDHGGTISVDSAIGRGTTFTIKLPVEATGSES